MSGYIFLLRLVLEYDIIGERLGWTIVFVISPAHPGYPEKSNSPYNFAEVTFKVILMQGFNVESAATPLHSSSSVAPLRASPQAQIPPDQILSSKPLSEWRGSLTTFNGFTGTIPVLELKDVGWPEIKNLICPPKPDILEDKKDGKYFVPCALKVASLVGKTLEVAQRNGEPTTGKMRSKGHVTEASLLVMDIDGLPSADVNGALKKVQNDGLTLVSYSTHSYGLEDKPGVRVRIVIPTDRPMAVEEYALAWHGFDQLYFLGRVGKADSSGAKLYQQQGTRCCHPDRVNKAKSMCFDGGVASADALILAGRVDSVQQVAEETPVHGPEETFERSTFPLSDANKIADACKQISQFRDTKGAGQSEPLWYDCLGVVGHCQNGEVLCQDWSSGHSGYTEGETEKKIAQRLRTPPTTCDQFRKTNPEGCTGCALKCHSPIALGRNSDDALWSAQREFFLINIEGKIWVCLQDGSRSSKTQVGVKKLTVSNRSDGTLQIVRFLRANYPHANAEECAKDFFSHPETTCYTGVEFNPNGTSGNLLNLWVGPTINPKKGDWTLIQSFLLKIICDGDQTAYSYLIKYISHALQRPEEKPGVMIIMLGGQGTGKGTLGRILQKIWGATYIQISNIDSVTGSFNAALECAFIVFMDEALFVGNRKASDALKSLVTEETIHVNEKYQPARQTKSYHRFIAATNAEHFKNTERDDRRDFTLRLSESRKGDHVYWKELNHEIQNGGVEAMVHDLLAMDLSDFNVRQKPNTKEFLTQKLLSLSHIPQWWFECLQRGSLSESDGWPDFVSTTDAIEGVLEMAGNRVYRKPSPISFVKEMKSLCPSAKKSQKQIGHERRRGLALPSLQQARDEFEEYIGGPVQWGEAEE